MECCKNPAQIKNFIFSFVTFIRLEPNFDIMKKILLSLVLLLQFFTGNAQTGIYKTYEDYVSGNILPMKKVDNIKTPRLAKMEITFLDSLDNKLTFMGNQIWGCIINGLLFRQDGKGFNAVTVIGKVCFYENGVVHLRKVTGDKSLESLPEDNITRVSAGLNGKYFDTFKKFLKANPGYESLEDCLNNITASARFVKGSVTGLADFSELNTAFRKCIEKFNAQ